MFDKLKQLQKLKEMQEDIKKEKVEHEENGIKVVVNGKFEIEEIHLNRDLSVEEQEVFLKKCLNQAVKKIQMNMAEKFSGMI